MGTSPPDPLRDVEDSTSRKIYRVPALWRFLLRFLRGAVPLFCRLEVTGDIPQRLRGGPIIVVSNHVGTFDPMALIAGCAKQGLAPRMLATGGLFRAPVFGAIMRNSGHIRVDRGSHTVTGALHHAVDALNEHSTVVLYPEGRISLDPGLWPERAKTGAARLALTTGAPVLSVAQWGAHEVMAYDGPLHMAATLISSIWRRPTVRIHFGDVVDLSDLDPTQASSVRVAADRMSGDGLDLLRALRTDEPVIPRHVDRIRPLSTARTYRPRPDDVTDDAS